MNVVLFGATGPSGKLVLRRALELGHTVTAYVRNPAKMTESDPRLTVIQGELTDGTGIARVVRGKHAVISLLGPSGKSTDLPVTGGTRRIIAAMEDHGVKRLIAASTPSASDRRDRFAFPFWLGTCAIKTLARSSYDEILGTAAAVRDSHLDWTLVRLPMLTDRSSGRPATVGYLGDPGIKLFSLSRDALADFFVAQLLDGTWIGKAPVLSNGR